MFKGIYRQHARRPINKHNDKACDSLETRQTRGEGNKNIHSKNGVLPPPSLMCSFFGRQLEQPLGGEGGGCHGKLPGGDPPPPPPSQ